jgi:SAM-dependent methyltransferase
VKIDPNLKMPPLLNEYMVMTLNNTGMMTTYLDEYTLQFIAYASKQKKPVLEVGATYGAVSIAALEVGATVIANDIEPQHLQILYNQTPEHCRSRLTLLPGKFPHVLNLPNSSLAGCYIARTLGFIEIPDIQRGLKLIYDALVPKGKIFIVSATLYTEALKNVIPIYEKRLLENHEWPGYFTDLKSLVNERYIPYTPDKLHFLHPPILKRELERVGFVVETAALYAREDFPVYYQFDGREGGIVIAHKP